MPTLKRPVKREVRRVNKEDRLKIYNSSKWRKLRLSKLMQNPLCEICLAMGKITPAEDVHHIDSFLNYNGSMRTYKAYDYNNLLSVCKECHAFLHKYGTTHSFNMEQIINDMYKCRDCKNKTKNSRFDEYEYCKYKDLPILPTIEDCDFQQ